MFNLRSGMPMPVYSSSIFFLTHVKKKRENCNGIQPIKFMRCQYWTIFVAAYVDRREEGKINERIDHLCSSYILSSHVGATCICLYAHTRVFYSVLIYGNRSSFSNQTHTMLSYMQINIRCTTTTCRAMRRIYREQ